MYDIETLTRAYFAVIKLADDCTSEDAEALSNSYHLVKFVRAVIRDSLEDTAWFQEFMNVLDISSARLKRRIGRNLKQYVLTETKFGSSTSGEGAKRQIYTPVTNAYAAVTYFIYKGLKNNETDNFLRLYNISDLYMQWLFRYADSVKARPYTEKSGDISIALYIIIGSMGYHIGYLENAMRAKGIKFNKIKI